MKDCQNTMKINTWSITFVSETCFYCYCQCAENHVSSQCVLIGGSIFSSIAFCDFNYLRWVVAWRCYLENPRKKQLSFQGSALLSTKGRSHQHPLWPCWISYLRCKALRSHFGYQVNRCDIAKVWSSNPRVVADIMSQYSCPSPLSDHYRGPA